MHHKDYVVADYHKSFGAVAPGPPLERGPQNLFEGRQRSADDFLLVISFGIIRNFLNFLGFFQFGGLPEKSPLISHWFRYENANFPKRNKNKWRQNIYFVLICGQSFLLFFI